MTRQIAASLFVTAVVTMSGFDSLEAQEEDRLDPVAERDGYLLLRGSGPEIGTWRERDKFGPLQLSWYMVQDSSIGLVFGAPSGIKRHRGGGELDGDLVLHALRPVRAFEVRAIIWDVWRDQSPRVLSATNLEGLLEDEMFRDYDPRWADVWREGRLLGTSFVYVAHVMYEDGTIRAADKGTVLSLVQEIDSNLTAEDLVPDPDSDPGADQGGT